MSFLSGLGRLENFALGAVLGGVTGLIALALSRSPTGAIIASILAGGIWMYFLGGDSLPSTLPFGLSLSINPQTRMWTT